MTTSPPPARPLREVALLFLRLGFTAFGGPAAHIAMMRDEVVTRRHWLTDAEFADLLGATNLIPGPNSTEMTIHLGYLRAGRAGLVVAGACFILPAMLMTMALAALYVQTRALPEAGWLLYGIKPVIIAIVAQALWGLGKTVLRSWFVGAVAAAAALAAWFGVNELVLLLLGALAVAVVRLPLRRATAALLALPGAALAPATQAAPVGFSLLQLLLSFLKIGSVLYGSGYVLLAFLKSEFVTRFGWLTDQQLLDAVAVGQFTPGPVFTTATFIGYLLGAPSGQGVAAALVATIGIFLPAFVFVAITHPFIPQLRRSPTLAALLDGVNAASLGLMAAVTAQLAGDAVVDWFSAAVALAALVALVRFRVNSAWLVLAGGALGLAYRLLV
jgi:chromate transporter